MVNHFRSALLNENGSNLVQLPHPYTAKEVHIAPEYVKVALPADFKAVYSLLFPINRLESKLYLAKIYLTLIESIGLVDATKLLDSRVTYTAKDDESEFSSSVGSVGLPAVGDPKDPGAWLRVQNYQFTPASTDMNPAKELTVTQLSNTEQVMVVDDRGTTWAEAITLVFTDGVSQLISLNDPYNVSSPLALKFSIGWPPSFSSGFTGSSGKQWTIQLSTVRDSILSKLYSKLLAKQKEIAAVLIKYKAPVDVSSYDNLWQQHPNWNYKVAGLIVSLVNRLSGLPMKNNPTYSVAQVVVGDHGECDGTITLTPSGGVGPFEYIWADGKTGNVRTALCQGSRSVVVVDTGTGDPTPVISINVPLISPLQASAISADETVTSSPGSVAFNSDGSITATFSDGTGPYYFYYSSPSDLNSPITSPFTIPSLTKGDYEIWIYDSIGVLTWFDFVESIHAVKLDVHVYREAFDAQISNSVTRALAALPQSTSLTFPQSDPVYGTLTSVGMTVDWTFRTSGRIENLDASPHAGTQHGATGTLTVKDVTNTLTIATDQLTRTFTDNLAAYDGVPDFGGASGASHSNSTTTNTFSGSGVSGSLTAYEGTGTISLPQSMTSAAFVTGPTLYLQQVTPFAAASWTIVYNSHSARS